MARCPAGDSRCVGPGWAAALGGNRAIGSFSRWRQLRAPSRGQLRRAGTHRHASAEADAAAAAGEQPLLAKNTLTFPVSPRSRHPGARRAALGTAGERGTGAGDRISPLRTRGTWGGGVTCWS